MNKADQQELAGLHGMVAKVLTEQLKDRITVDEEGEVKELYTAAPAVLAQAIKFLKDNDITASIEDSDNLSELDEMLKRKREKRNLRLVGDAQE